MAGSCYGGDEILRLFPICGLIFIVCGAIHADPLPTTEELMKVDSSAKQFSQLFLVQAGSIKPRSVAISNGDYDFKYGNGKDNLSSVVAEVGWSVKLVDFLGSWHLEEGLDYMSFSGTASSSIRGTSQTQSLRLNVLGLDSRIMYSMDWFPWKRLLPFLDGGYQVAFYSQASTSDLESASGSAGNFVGGAGIRFWLNRGSFSSGNFISHVESIPVFVVLKYNRIYANNLGFDLGSSSYMAGLQLGL